MPKPRLAVVSPFIDKRHGTERRVAEWVSRLTDDYEVHVYSPRVEDLDLSKFTWHRIPEIPGPHLVKFLWWVAANHLWRWRDRRFRGLRPDLVFAPGINCLDADVISVHIVFAEFVRQARAELSLRRNPLWFWPRLIHRRLYYQLIIFLERRVYRNPRNALILIARKTAGDLKRFYDRTGPLPVVYIGLDHEKFNPEQRLWCRAEARRQLGFEENMFVLLLIGNDWKKKGLPCLLEAMRHLKELPLRLVVAGQDESYLYQKRIQEYGLQGKIFFQPPRQDVERLYAAADAYVGPSLEDTFAQPPAEAMACGLSVITSTTNGSSEIITDGVDGLILQNPMDAAELASKIRLLLEAPDLCRRLGEKAAQTAQGYTWDRNGVEIRQILAGALQRKIQQG